ncbi:unnamed protein product [Closterium sp. Naga37s-1]|nr:unnamed protein product [Closterium sp. Naga37s-1]
MEISSHQCISAFSFSACFAIDGYSSSLTRRDSVLDAARRPAIISTLASPPFDHPRPFLRCDVTPAAHPLTYNTRPPVHSALSPSPPFPAAPAMSAAGAEELPPCVLLRNCTIVQAGGAGVVADVDVRAAQHVLVQGKRIAFVGDVLPSDLLASLTASRPPVVSPPPCTRLLLVQPQWECLRGNSAAAPHMPSRFFPPCTPLLLPLLPPMRPFPLGCQEIDLAGRYLLPGLCDAHMHVTAAACADLHALAALPVSLVACRAARGLQAMLMRGFTTVRDAGGCDQGLAQPCRGASMRPFLLSPATLRPPQHQAVEEGTVIGPRILISGHALSQTGGHGDMRKPSHDTLPVAAPSSFSLCACSSAASAVGGLGIGRVCDGEAEVRRAVREELRRGARQIKVMASGGVSSPSDRVESLQFSEGEMRAAVEEAEAQGTYVMAHAYAARAIKRAVECGVRSIEHGNMLDEEGAELMLQRGSFLVPTLVTYERIKQAGQQSGMDGSIVAKVQDLLERGLQAVALAEKKGVPIVFGSDLLGPMQSHQLQEFAIRSKVQSPASVLRSATTAAARLFGMEGEIGSVAVGALADLIVLDGNPLDGISDGSGGTSGGNGGSSDPGMAEIKSVGGDGWGVAKRAFQQGVAKIKTTAAAAAAAAAAINLDGPSRRRPDVHSAAVQEFSQFLKDSHRRLISSAGLPASRIVHSYRYLMNAFSARLTAAEAESLKKQAWVDRVERSQMVRAATTHTPDFLNLPNKVWPQLGGESRAGENVIVGLIDSGIWPEHPAFSDKTSTPYGPPPSRWRGGCNTTADFPRCSQKIIGAQWFVAGLKAEGGRIDPSIEFLSPRDANSHGSWCAGAAAGNAVRVKSGAQPLGTARGMAPRARLAIYKALWFDGQVAMGSEADVYKAVDRAVADGVDLLSMSVAFSDENYFKHLPLMRAAQAGVLPVLVAGNLKAPPDSDDGQYRTIRNASPYYLTVAASTTDRAWPPQATLRLQDGAATTASARTAGGRRTATADDDGGGGVSAEAVTVVGVTYHAGTAHTVNLSLVDGAAAAASNVPLMQARMCLPGALSPARVAGRMVLCEAGGTTPEAKAGEVRRAGGRAIVIASASATAGSVGEGYALDLPSLVVNRSMSQALRSFLNSSSSPRATLSSLSLQSNQVAPVMAPFSSTGPIVDPSLPPGRSPDGFTNDILKPDITGPGVNLLGPMASGKHGEAAYQLLSGTSMAVPHLVGIAALIMQKYPSWSPAAVKSAIMTTGTVFNNRNEPIRTASGHRATPWNFGSGHVVAVRAMDPGLVYNVGAKGYMAFLFGINANTASKVFQHQQVPQKGGGRTVIKAYDLNLPNICVSNLVKQVTVVRRVTNVARQASKYRARVVAPKNVRVVVAPGAFTIAPGASQVFSVTFTVVQATRAFSFGSLTWVDGTHRVRSVLAVQPVQA